VPHDLDDQRRLEKHAGEDARYLFEGRHRPFVLPK
jgi:hypothetical protein